MNINLSIKEAGLFVAMIMADIGLIQLFRHVTPLIIPLRIGFVFAVIAASIMAYYWMIKPVHPVHTGSILSLACGTIALCEAYIVHVVIEKTQFRMLFLLPCSFGLVLPFALSFVYQKFSTKERKI
jgi:hypothetical protein